MKLELNNGVNSNVILLSAVRAIVLYTGEVFIPVKSVMAAEGNKPQLNIYKE